MVYIREAHAIDGQAPMANGPLVEEPITDGERHSVAKTCVTKLSLQMIPAVVDRIDNAVDAAYQARPDRLYLVGRDGRIAYAGGRGPFGFKPDELVDAIEKELAKPTTETPRRESKPGARK